GRDGGESNGNRVSLRRSSRISPWASAELAEFRTTIWNLTGAPGVYTYFPSGSVTSIVTFATPLVRCRTTVAVLLPVASITFAGAVTVTRSDSGFEAAPESAVADTKNVAVAPAGRFSVETLISPVPENGPLAPELYDA